MLFFLLLACNSQEPQKQQSKKVDVKLHPEVPGNVEIPISEMSEVVPESIDWNEGTKKRVWSLFHLIETPCAAEKGSMLSSLKKGTCTASVLLKKRALNNLDLGDDALIDMLTVSDSWFPDALQGKSTVTLELWVDEPILAEERLLSQLKQLKDAQLRICVRTKSEERVQAYALPVGQEVSEISSLFIKNVNRVGACSSSLEKEVRSSPTWFVEGFRLRGFQSIRSIQRLISLSNKDKE